MLQSSITESSVQMNLKGARRTTPKQYSKFIIMIIECWGNQSTHLTKYPQQPNRVGIKLKQYHNLASLKFDFQAIFKDFNCSLDSLLDMDGISAIDEAIWHFNGESNHLIHIPRKPKSTGIRVYFAAFGSEQKLQFCIPCFLS